MDGYHPLRDARRNSAVFQQSSHVEPQTMKVVYPLEKRTGLENSVEMLKQRNQQINKTIGSPFPLPPDFADSETPSDQKSSGQTSPLVRLLNELQDFDKTPQRTPLRDLSLSFINTQGTQVSPDHNFSTDLLSDVQLSCPRPPALAASPPAPVPAPMLRFKKDPGNGEFHLVRRTGDSDVMQFASMLHTNIRQLKARDSGFDWQTPTDSEQDYSQVPCRRFNSDNSIYDSSNQHNEYSDSSRNDSFISYQESSQLECQRRVSSLSGSKQTNHKRIRRVEKLSVGGTEESEQINISVSLPRKRIDQCNRAPLSTLNKNQHLIQRSSTAAKDEKISSKDDYHAKQILKEITSSQIDYKQRGEVTDQKVDTKENCASHRQSDSCNNNINRGIHVADTVTRGQSGVEVETDSEASTQLTMRETEVKQTGPLLRNSRNHHPVDSVVSLPERQQEPHSQLTNLSGVEFETDSNSSTQSALQNNTFLLHSLQSATGTQEADSTLVILSPESVSGDVNSDCSTLSNINKPTKSKNKLLHPVHVSVPQMKQFLDKDEKSFQRSGILSPENANRKPKQTTPKPVRKQGSKQQVKTRKLQRGRVINQKAQMPRSPPSHYPEKERTDVLSPLGRRKSQSHPAFSPEQKHYYDSEKENDVHQSSTVALSPTNHFNHQLQCDNTLEVLPLENGTLLSTSSQNRFIEDVEGDLSTMLSPPASRRKSHPAFSPEQKHYFEEDGEVHLVMSPEPDVRRRKSHPAFSPKQVHHFESTEGSDVRDSFLENTLDVDNTSSVQIKLPNKSLQSSASKDYILEDSQILTRDGMLRPVDPETPYKQAVKEQLRQAASNTKTPNRSVLDDLSTSQHNRDLSYVKKRTGRPSTWAEQQELMNSVLADDFQYHSKSTKDSSCSPIKWNNKTTATQVSPTRTECNTTQTSQWEFVNRNGCYGPIEQMAPPPVSSRSVSASSRVTSADGRVPIKSKTSRGLIQQAASKLRKGSQPATRKYRRSVKVSPERKPTEDCEAASLGWSVKTTRSLDSKDVSRPRKVAPVTPPTLFDIRTAKHPKRVRSRSSGATRK